MQVLSLEWFAWMAGTVALYWLLPAAVRAYGLMAVTLAFVAFYDPLSAVLLTVFTGVLALTARHRERPPGAAIATMAVAVLGTVAYFKIQVSGGMQDLVTDVAIPLGLSYYAFRCVHYLIERYRGSLPEHGPTDVVAYLFFLPTIIVGPIHRAGQFFEDHARVRWDASKLSEGMERILYGYAKIAILGNYLTGALLGGYIDTLGSEQLVLAYYLEMVRNGLNLYFQFSGFSDVAIGFALLLGYRVMENFNWPYLARNIADFWQRWHMSLTTWSRDYIYMPAFGYTRNPYLATLASLLFIGLWHEISLRYICWGLYHGLGIVAFRRWQRLERRLNLPRVEHPVGRGMLTVLKILMTVHYVWLSFILVSQPDLGSAAEVFYTLLISWWV
jgi:alginate O-acetyltransferase complex protein AlgI